MTHGPQSKKILGQALRTLAHWKTGNGGENDAAMGGDRPRMHCFGKGVLSRVPKGWWGHGGGRILALMHEERRKLHGKRSAGFHHLQFSRACTTKRSRALTVRKSGRKCARGDRPTRAQRTLVCCAPDTKIVAVRSTCTRLVAE